MHAGSRGELQTGVAKESLPEKLAIRWKIKLTKGIESTAAAPSAGTLLA